MDDASLLAQKPEVTLCTYADLMRVPGSNGMSLMKARAAGADVRMVYSTLDALRIAQAEPLVFCNHVLTPAAIQALVGSPEAAAVPIDGFVGPAHVSTVIGMRPYTSFAENYRKAVVIAGFEPLDVMQSVLMLVRQINEGRHEIENEYARAVTEEGNRKAQDIVALVFAHSRPARAKWSCPRRRA